MKLLLFLCTFVFITNSHSQIASKYFIFAKDYSKELSLYNSKKFVIEQILGDSKTAVKFEIDPLAAASSGELTSLVYQSPELNKEGMLLGFYGNYWNNAGVVYQGFAFKNLPKDKALQLLSEIEKHIAASKKYLAADRDNNNVYFTFDDLTILIYSGVMDIKIRVFWENFDADWDNVAFKRTKKRLEKKLD